MNLLYGDIVEVFAADGLPAARLRAGRALKNISLALVADAEPGDVVLVCDGVAIGKVENERKENHVPRDSR
ncbi:MAG TPA: HypC/HybG/HupF family hydrogenase formation chaperone [Candidatus Polarisedimenticolia bacterium]|nr:HypC/HybG/HupF family hydrogenase formation chaperone [Candidatus Polarisedimenticolia bacterium]